MEKTRKYSTVTEKAMLPCNGKELDVNHKNDN